MPPWVYPRSGFDDPFLAPFRRQFDGALADGNDFQTEPLMVGTARQQLLDVFDARNFAHVLKNLV